MSAAPSAIGGKDRGQIDATVVTDMTLVQAQELMECVELICWPFCGGHVTDQLPTLLQPGERAPHRGIGRRRIKSGRLG